MEQTVLPVFLFAACAFGLALGLLSVAGALNPARSGQVAEMPYESGMDPIHDARRCFDVRFHLLAIAFLVFDVELLFLYPWAVARGRGAIEMRQGGAEETAEVLSPRLPVSGSPCLYNAPNRADHPAASRHLAFAGMMAFVALLAAGFIYDWRKGVFYWR